MINLDQVRTLEWKVKQAVQLIVHLRRENDTLRGRLSDTEVRLLELESLLESFKATQNEMESGIRSALEDLDNLDEGVSPPSTGPVDALSYPPATPVASEIVHETVAAPEVVVEVAAEPSAEPEVAAATPEVAEPTFEEEYAALAAAEAEALAGDSFDSAVSEEITEPVRSVELEEEAFFEEPQNEVEIEVQVDAETHEPEPVVPEEKQPEQPGLGIF